MSKAIFVFLGGLAAGMATAQAPLNESNPRVVYGTNMGSLDGKFMMNVGTGKPGECGTKLWYHDPGLIVKKEPAGSCVPLGSAGPPIPQYKITFIEDTPEERA